jgi:hypothetical protein
MLNLFGSECINIYDELTNFSDYTIKPQYSLINDLVHTNDLGHAYISSQIFPKVKNWIETSNGFVNGDNPGNLGGSLSLTCNATASSPLGNYAIIASGDLSSPNYTISYVSGTLTVNKATATVTLTNLTQVYDGSPKQVTCQLILPVSPLMLFIMALLPRQFS